MIKVRTIVKVYLTSGQTAEVEGEQYEEGDVLFFTDETHSVEVARFKKEYIAGITYNRIPTVIPEAFKNWCNNER